MTVSVVVSPDQTMDSGSRMRPSVSGSVAMVRAEVEFYEGAGSMDVPVYYELPSVEQLHRTSTYQQRKY
jgi:hypothetical protein